MLVTNFTSWADPVRQENPQQTKGPPTSGEYINNFDSVKYNRIISQVFFAGFACEFRSFCGNRRGTSVKTPPQWSTREKHTLRGLRCPAIFANCRYNQAEDDELNSSRDHPLDREDVRDAVHHVLA